MGNSNSGKYGGKLKCEQCLFIDVRLLARKGVLKEGIELTWEWTNGSNIRMVVRDSWIDLQYTINEVSKVFPVYLNYTDCQYGGRRAWWCCPRCGKRKAKLYLRSGHFACRGCHRLVYKSQALDTIGRCHRAYSRVQSKLNDSDMKPKGMHWRTFERLQGRMIAIDGRINQAFNLTAERLFKRIGIL